MKKILSVLLAAAMAATLLAGCGQSSGTSGTSGTDSSGGAPAEEKVITYSGPDEWVRSQLQTDKGGYDKVVEQFEKDNPGVKVKLTSEPWGTWQQKLPVVIAGGDAPDVFMLNGTDAASYYNGGYTTDLGDMDKEFLDKFYPGVLAQYQDGDTVMALPFTTDCRILWYNKEIFKAAGLDENTPPKTWDELVEYAKACSEATVDGQKVYGFGMDLGLKEVPAASLLCASDAMLFDTETGKPTINNDTFKKYVQTLVDMKDTFEPDYATLNHENVATLFGQKKVGIIIAGAWVWSLNEGLDEEDWYGTAMVPKMDENSPEGSYAGGWAVAVSSKSENVEEAKKFAQALYDEDLAYMLHTDVPPFTGGDEKCDLFKNPKAEIFREEMQYGRQLMPPTTVATEVKNLVWEEVGNAVMGKSSVDDCIGNIETKMTDILK